MLISNRSTDERLHPGLAPDTGALIEGGSPLRALHDLGDLKAGNLEVFIAGEPRQIEAAQRLRYRVFCEEMGAKPGPHILESGRDVDEFDAVCDHLLVVEHQPDGSARVVGTYRLLRREAMARLGRFYSAGEYDISAIERYPGEILELGRSCVDPQYRSRAVMQLLWRGIGAYVARFSIELLFGCASFAGTDPKRHALALSYLHHFHLAPEQMRTVALPARYVDMNILPSAGIDEREAFALLPALIKGYLRLGGHIGLGAVIDPEYNTTDVGIIVKLDLVTDKYAQRYGK